MSPLMKISLRRIRSILVRRLRKWRRLLREWRRTKVVAVKVVIMKRLRIAMMETKITTSQAKQLLKKPLSL